MADLVGGPELEDPLGPDALDFWLGDWAVSWGGGGSGTNSIRKILDDRVVEETFEGRDADSVLLGHSVSVLDPSDGRWRQTWVDSNGSYLDFVGLEVDGRIAFQRRASINDAEVLQRMVWLGVTVEALTWQWMRSDDDGATWRVIWKIDYRRI